MQQQSQSFIDLPTNKSEKSVFTMKNGERTTTDGGYQTISLVDGSIDGGDCTTGKKQTTLPPVNSTTRESNDSLSFHQFKDSSTMSLCSTTRENHHIKRKPISRAVSQQIDNILPTSSDHRLSLPDGLKPLHESSITSTSSSCLSLSNSQTKTPIFQTKNAIKLCRLLNQMIECESECILEHFLKQNQQELYDYFNTDKTNTKLKTYDILSNVKSEKIYNVLLRYSFKTTICDKNNNTLLHLLFKNRPYDYDPKQLKIITERYLNNGLKEFLNRPNLSNEYIVQILLQNDYFLQLLFFSQTKEFENDITHYSPLMCSNNRHNSTDKHAQDVFCKQHPYHYLPYCDVDYIEEWRETYLNIILLLVESGARIDMPTG
ncbi:unnamed protein product, partial [Didymodactylos carnosus]